MLSKKLVQCILATRPNLNRLVTTTARLQDNDTPRIEKTINQVSLLGRVGNDPQVRGNEQHPVVTFSLATHNNYKYESGDMLQRTDWHRISIFKPHLRDLAMNYVKKGNRIYLQGRIAYGEVRNAEGQVRTSSSIVADDIIFLQKPSENNIADEETV